MDAWTALVLAGVLEVVWAAGLKLSRGFSSPGWSLLTAAAMGASFYFLARAAELPLGTAYVIWTGIGAAGAFLTGIAFFREPVTPARCLFAALLLCGIAGMKLTAL